MENNSKEQKSRCSLRLRIIEVAMEAFMHEGIKNVRMDDIANSLSISKRTLYEIFKDKEELLFECVKNRQEKQSAFFEKIAKESENVLELILKYYIISIETLQKINRRYFEDMKRYSLVNEYLMQCRQRDALNAMDYYRKGVEQGIFRSDINFKIFHKLMNGQMDMFIDGAYFGDYSLAEVFNTIVMVNMRGISTGKGHKILDDFLLNNK